MKDKKRNLPTLLPGIMILAICFFAAPASASVVVSVEKSTQRMTVTVDGAIRYRWPVSTGRKGYATPSGSFRAFRMEAEHYSKEWDEAPMPHSIFFTDKGHAIHGSYDVKRLGRPASHGCVRLSPAHAAILFSLVRKSGLSNTKVVLNGGRIGPSAIARAKLQEYRPQRRRPLNSTRMRPPMRTVRLSSPQNNPPAHSNSDEAECRVHHDNPILRTNLTRRSVSPSRKRAKSGPSR